MINLFELCQISMHCQVNSRHLMADECLQNEISPSLIFNLQARKNLPLKKL